MRNLGGSGGPDCQSVTEKLNVLCEALLYDSRRNDQEMLILCPHATKRSGNIGSVARQLPAPGTRYYGAWSRSIYKTAS